MILLRSRTSMLMLCLAVCLLSPLPSSAEEFAFLLRARGNPYWKAVAQGVEESAKAQGANAVVFMMESESDGEEQLNVCNALIERKPRLLAIVAANTASGIQCLKRAHERGIAAGDIDATIPLEQAKAAGIDLRFTVGSDNYSIGERAADFAAAANTGRNVKVLVLEGAPGIIPGKKRVDGFKDKLGKTLPGAQIAASLTAYWDRLKAASVTTDILQRHPDLGLIYAANDVMALGAAEAVRSAGKSQQVQIIGVDGTADARRAVEEGRLTATVAQLPYLIGKRALELALRPDKAEYVNEVTPTPLLTKDVLREKSEPLLQYVR